MENPHIVSDSQNNLHLTYDYNTGNPGATVIVYKLFNNINWSDFDTISIGWPGARHNRLVIDNNDKLYCFWYHGYQNGTTFYRVMENGIWSEIMIPYNNNDTYFLSKAISDSLNKIHCCWYRLIDGQTSNEQRIIYSVFNNNTWSEITQISNGFNAWTGNDIALDNSNYPHIVWRQAINDSTPQANGTLYSKLDSNIWSTPIILSENASEQTITIDRNNKTHIIDNEELQDGFELIHYQFINNEWIGEIIDEYIYGNYWNKLLSRDQFLYMISGKAYESAPNTNISIILRKYEITTNIKDFLTPAICSFIIFPNPSSGNTTITYSMHEKNHVSIKIYDMQGILINTILNIIQAPGKYQISWNGTDKNGRFVNNGIYFIQLQKGKQITTHSIEVIK